MVLAVAAPSTMADNMPMDLVDSGNVTAQAADALDSTSLDLILNQDLGLLELSVSTSVETVADTDLMSVWNASGIDSQVFASDALFLQGGENGVLSMAISNDPFAVSIYDVSYTSVYLPTTDTMEEIGGLASVKLDSGLAGLQAIPEPTVLALCSVFGGGFLVIRRLFRD